MQRPSPIPALERPRISRTSRLKTGLACAGVVFGCAMLPLLLPLLQTSPSAIGKSSRAEGFPMLATKGENLPFLRFGPRGWALTDPVPGEDVSECVVLERRFHCLTREKAQHSSELHRLEQELTVRPQ